MRFFITIKAVEDFAVQSTYPSMSSRRKLSFMNWEKWRRINLGQYNLFHNTQFLKSIAKVIKKLLNIFYRKFMGSKQKVKLWIRNHYQFTQTCSNMSNCFLIYFLHAEKRSVKFTGSSVLIWTTCLFSKFYQKLNSINRFSVRFTQRPVKSTEYEKIRVKLIVLYAK